MVYEANFAGVSVNVDTTVLSEAARSYAPIAGAALGAYLLGKALLNRTPAYNTKFVGKVRKAPTTQQYPSIVQELRATYLSNKTKSIEWRQQQLLGLLEFMKNHRDEIEEAMKKDNLKTEGERFLELRIVEGSIRHDLKHFQEWMKDEAVGTPVWMAPASSYIRREPLGVVLIIAPWNYPMNLTVQPLAQAFAAGNCAVVKPSELAPHQSAVMAKYLPRYLDNSAFAIIEGAVDETKALLNEKWDFVLFTGGTGIARIINQQLAASLTPVCLELGGKSPTIVDKNVDLAVACNRIVQGKFNNCGQTCVAPDYVLCHREIYEDFLKQMKETVENFYGQDPRTGGSYARIINERHFDRVSKYIKDGKVLVGGVTDRSECYIAPTILRDVRPDSSVMSEENEIFGPVLPVLPMDSIYDGIKFVNQRPKPLALYVFSKDSKVADLVNHSTSSGGFCVNEAVFQFATNELPFGGVGDAGQGRYHSKYGFDQFSHLKSVIARPFWGDLWLRYPPFTGMARATFDLLMP
eukprot:Clim_evm43s108 gene=Clim_evmTU43s108